MKFRRFTECKTPTNAAVERSNAHTLRILWINTREPADTANHRYLSCLEYLDCLLQVQYFFAAHLERPILLPAYFKANLITRMHFSPLKQSDLAAAVNPTEPVMTTPFVVAAAMNDQKVSRLYPCRRQCRRVRLPSKIRARPAARHSMRYSRSSRAVRLCLRRVRADMHRS